ncbi:hypothetical protein V3C99_011435 [Haemonchus contortus]
MRFNKLQKNNRIQEITATDRSETPGIILHTPYMSTSYQTRTSQLCLLRVNLIWRIVVQLLFKRKKSQATIILMFT